MSRTLQFIQQLFNDPSIVALKEWGTVEGQIGVYQSKEHVYVLAYDFTDYYMHPYNPDLKEKAIAGAETIAAIAGAMEI